ncbi:hypothetical protein NECAME_07305 [Necator americanus]|uniref:G-protein coupled receptors family 1 profile domain-containing protein n=1 Tax=Necator americanus TaxID=51031 RepID=W2TPE5_NECAM|nr:hypothetical protein NECAME_07305 [Necator americanus]ETN83648.1 hypothetical protein NECAME_07305 [Necator americanus]
MFCFDRLVFMVIPVVYARVSRTYLNWILVILLAVPSCALIAPAFALSIESLRNDSMVISSFCRINSVTGEEYYENHVMALQYLPIIGMGCITFSLIIFGIRRLKQSWSYNWSEESEHSKQDKNGPMICLRDSILNVLI